MELPRLRAIKYTIRHLWPLSPRTKMVAMIALAICGCAASALVITHGHSKEIQTNLSSNVSDNANNSIPIGTQSSSCVGSPGIQQSPTIQGGSDAYSSTNNCSNTTAPSTSSATTPSSMSHSTPTNSKPNPTPSETQQQANETVCNEDGFEPGNVLVLNGEYSATSQTTEHLIQTGVEGVDSSLLNGQQELTKINQEIDSANSYYTSYYNAYLSTDKQEGCTPTAGLPQQIPECQTIQECASTPIPYL